MAPAFFAKFVKTNDNHPRARTSSDLSDIRGRRSASSSTFEVQPVPPPSVILTSENSNSPTAPSTPGSLHRKDSPRRSRSTATTPLSPLKDLNGVTDIPQTMSPESVPAGSPDMGLGIDLGQLPKLPEPAHSNPSGQQKGTNGNINGFDHSAKRKVSSKSLKSLKSQQTQETVPPVPQSQEIETSPKATILVESPTSDATPTTTNFSVTTDAVAIPPSSSTMSQGLQSRLKDPDNVSLSSAGSSNKKMSWRRGSAASKKRKPTGLASAIAASGLAMANPGVNHSLAQFAPQPNSPPRSQPTSPPQSVVSRKRGSSDASNGVARSYATTNDNDQFYSDSDSGSEDGLEVDDEIPVTGFAVASNKRNADFHDLFPQVPDGDYLIEDYGCALQRDILIQGRLYISENHICFHANIFGWVTDLIVPVYEITAIEKRMTALIIPNAIQITTRTSKYTFASFLSRDTTYDVINNIWRLCRPEVDSLISGDASARASLEDTAQLQATGNGSSTAGTSVLSPFPSKITECKCGKDGLHFGNTAMIAFIPGTVETVYNLMFASGFIKDFMIEEQGLKDLQISDWMVDPESKVLSRKFSYIKILNGMVKQTKCELVDETQYCDFNDYVTTVTTTRTPDVPSGGAFAVKTRTCIMWAGAATTKVVVTTQVDWTGRSFIKSMINSSAIDGQKKYHADLEKAMRKYIAINKSEFVPEGMEEVAEAPIAVEAVGVPDRADGSVPLTEEEANRKREHERNQRATQWAFDTIMGAWNVAKQSTMDALELVGDAWDQSSVTTILYFVIVVLVISNMWTLLMVGRREEVGRRKEMMRVEEQKRWVAGIIAALTEERQLRYPNDLVAKAIPAHGEPWEVEIHDLNNALDAVEERVRQLRKSLNELD